MRALGHCSNVADPLNVGRRSELAWRRLDLVVRRPDLDQCLHLVQVAGQLPQLVLGRVEELHVVEVADGTRHRLEEVVAEVHVFERTEPADAGRQFLVLVVLHLQPPGVHLQTVHASATQHDSVAYRFGIYRGVRHCRKYPYIHGYFVASFPYFNGTPFRVRLYP